MLGLDEGGPPINGSHIHSELNPDRERDLRRGLINLQKRFRFRLPLSLHRAPPGELKSEEEEAKLSVRRKNRKN